jgi:hypothetical protein
VLSPAEEVKTFKMSKQDLSAETLSPPATGAAAMSVAPHVPVVTTAPSLDLALINGRIHTMDARNTIAST